MTRKILGCRWKLLQKAFDTGIRQVEKGRRQFGDINFDEVEGENYVFGFGWKTTKF